MLGFTVDIFVGLIDGLFDVGFNVTVALGDADLAVDGTNEGFLDMISEGRELGEPEGDFEMLNDGFSIGTEDGLKEGLSLLIDGATEGLPNGLDEGPTLGLSERKELGKSDGVSFEKENYMC